MSAEMNEPIVNIGCRAYDGDERIHAPELVLWDFCVKARR
jgi:hypothetical protein